MLESTTVNIRGIITMTKTPLFYRGAIALLLSALIPAFAAAQSLDRIRSQGAVNIGFVKDAAPFSSASSDGSAQGYSIDLCARVVDKLKSTLGVPGLKVNYKAASVSAGLDMVANGGADILCGSVTDTLGRRERVSFSIAVYNGGMGVLVSSNADKALLRVLKGEVAHKGPIWRSTVNQGLANHTYAVHAGTVTEELVREKIAGLGVQATIVAVDDHQVGVDMVAQGKADAYFADRAILSRYSVAKDKVTLLERYFTYEPIALAVPRGDEDMRLLVDTVLSELYLSDQFEGFYTDHFGQPGEATLMFFKAFARQP